MTPNPGFKVTGYLKVEYLADGAIVFNCTKHRCRSLGALPKTCKKLGVVAEIFLLKALDGVLHHWWKLGLTELVFVETSTQTCSLSEEGFGYNCGWLKSSASHASRENTLLRCEKFINAAAICSDGLSIGRTNGGYLGRWRCIGRVLSVVYNASAVTRGAGHMLSEKSQWTQNGTMFIDLD